ncbi:hypothetical protein JTE90_003811 [Oedothorax gibbosus]|uniref:acetylcholinesterase n=1 Tax=Oedothorax gibbosus TaxID=931172 RepID=A0AAV6VHQ1_9ARAC|nr:hypothetical protein JTE90_003811 [Oedothorax gibbosus]
MVLTNGTQIGINMETLQLLIIYGLTLYQTVNSQEPSVEIDGNRIIGQRVEFYGLEAHQYLGIPYAEPPVGDLRFQKTKPYQNYPPELKAFYNPPACPQYTDLPLPWHNETTKQSEDCLYLNIWAPPGDGTGEKKAVLFWMHGGEYRYGSISDPVLNGTRIVVASHIILVTVNYRLGYLGFFTSNSEDAPGNLALWDVLEALKWVNKNIGAFGGDASRITIGGETAGAVNVGYLTVSPLAKGLFARQIVMTASIVTRRLDNNTRNLASSQQLAEYLGCANTSYTIQDHPKEVVNCLQGVDASKIAKADFEMSSKTGYNMVPQYGDEFLPKDPRTAVIKGDFTCTDLLTGNVKDVGSYRMTTRDYKDYFGFFGEKNPHVNRLLGEEIIRNGVQNFPNPEEIVKYYLPDNLTDDSNFQIRTQAYTAQGDSGFLCPTVYYAEQCAKQGKHVYYYLFTHRPSNSKWSSWMGTTNYDDVPFLFGHPISNPEYTSEENLLSDRMIGDFTNFVKNGDPDEAWPLYMKQSPIYQVLERDAPPGEDQESGPHTANCEFLKPYFGF